MKKNMSLLLVFSILFMLVGCSGQVTTESSTATQTESETTTKTETQIEVSVEKPVVYATIFPVYSLTKSIGGDLIDLKMAMPAGADPHDYEPSAKIIAGISEASLLVYNGLEIESWVESAEDSFTESGVALSELSHDVALIDFTAKHDHDHEAEEGHDHEAEEGHDHEAEEEHDHEAEEGHDHEAEEDHDHEAEEDHDHEGEEEHDHEHHHHHGDKDPHIWQSPKNMMVMAKNVYEALKTVVAEENHSILEENYTAVVKELEALDAEMAEVLSKTKRKEIVVGHAAFGYLTNDYNLVQIPIAGLSTLDEPSPAMLAEIVELAKEHGVTTVFYDSLGSDKLAKVIAEETGVELKPLHTLGMVSQEALDAEKTYVDLMRDNLKSLELALND